MGPLFQLIFLGIFYTILSFIVGTTLSLLFGITAKLRHKENYKSLAKEAFYFPFKLIPYLIIALIAGLFICGLRGVDIPFGDSWSVSLTKNSELLAIDTTDKWHIYPTEPGEPISGEIATFNMNKNIAYGTTTNGLNFIYELSSGKYQEIQNNEIFNNSIQKFGSVSLPAMTPTEYYYNQRGRGDLFTFILLMIYPLFKFFRLSKKLL